ncbi:EamA family transporter [Pyxidicoccus fallax]|uniref:EamA family transporter n=1 Tax=Pyxidicoccus fallax TaxID=394095 RepID=A0A848LUH4_9BACT|nr:EamA family transporter [Pyxidicoccus fallax]NMO21270.1 EamA family transporter [Pyxidicoccus fallax]NPC86255.1 EamA family transporter [Pyxidicoccus fallax]
MNPPPHSQPRPLRDAPLLLLITTGVLLGSMLPMSRVARAEGWSPLAFAFWPALGSGLALVLMGGRSTTPPASARPLLRYGLIAGVLSVAVPNSVTFVVMQHLGTSLTSLMYTLPPLFTYAFAWGLGIERYRPLRLAGILVGLVGAAMLVLGRYSAGTGSMWWLGLALCTPISIAMGNVYRKLSMPAGVSSGVLAGGMLLGGALALLPLLVMHEGALVLSASAWGVILAQCVFTSLGYRVYFHFQRVADPVYFSQFGYVLSATGVLSGLLFFHERLMAPTVVAMGIIVAGIALVNMRPREAGLPQQAPSPPPALGR